MAKRLIIALSLTVFLISCGKENKKKENTTEISIVREKQIAQFSMDCNPETLDPRRAHDLKSINMIQLTYEGLTRMQDTGKISPGVAKRVSVSDDGCIYTFYLHECTWSNQDPITSKDFELTWKSILNDDVVCPSKHLFFVIKNAKNIAEKTAPLDDLAVRCIDEKTLEVTLEHPCAYFPNLVACHAFFPIHNTLRDNKDTTQRISNGPFTADMNDKKLILKKNNQYLDKHKILLDEVHFFVVENNQALKLFETGKLDWVGFPCMSMPQENLLHITQTKHLKSCQVAKLFYLQINCNNQYMKNINLRKAFCQALDKKSIGTDILGSLHETQNTQLPTLQGTAYGFEDTEKLLKTSLTELGIHQSDLQSLTLVYCNEEAQFREIAEKIQSNYKRVFSLDITPIPCSAREYNEKKASGDYSLLITSTTCDFLDQSCYLEAVSKVPGWHNERYLSLLSKADFEIDSSKRIDLLEKAHKILLEDVPIVPLFQGTYTYLKNDDLTNAKVTPLGFLDLRYAHFKWNQKPFREQ